MNRWIIAFLVSLIITILHIVVLYSSVGERLEPMASDVWFRMRGELTAPPEVVIVAMDETSYGVLGLPLHEPWPRALHAKLLNRLADLGAKRVVFDVLFLGEGSDPASDTALAAALKKVPTILGTQSIMKDFSSSSGSFRLEELLEPYDPLLQSAAGIGLVTLPEDYGYIRRFLTERTAQTRELLTLGQAGAGINPKQDSLPSDRDFMNFIGPRGAITTLSYYQVMEEKKPLPPQVLRDKIVVVGLTLATDVGPAQKDIFLTPFGRLFGTEVHATVINNLLDRSWIRRLPAWAEISVLGLLTLILSAALLLLRPHFGAMLALGSFILWCGASYVAFLNHYFVPGALLTTVIMPFTLLVSTLYYYFVTRRDQLKIRNAFGLYLSPQMVEQVAQNPQALKLGGEKIWATALFTDIEGFSTITEEMPAERVAAMLNAYFTSLVDVVLDHGGTLVKFVGDGAYILWGAPIHSDDHAQRASETALLMQKEIERFNASSGFPALHTRIGIHTGPIVAGNLGSSRRFDYTGIGDAVNLAARIEGINKHFGTSVLITDAVKKELGGSLQTLQAGNIKVVGKREIIGIHFLLHELPPREVCGRWLDALQSFRQRDWAEARENFAWIQGKFEGLARGASLYLRTIGDLEKRAPGEEWQGEIIFLEK